MAAPILSPPPSGQAAPAPGSTGPLTLAAVGAVFADIGTSPLYAIRETFSGVHPLPADSFHVLGVISLVLWSLIVVVSLKYVSIMMRADNRGEGGSLALSTLVAAAAAQEWPRLGRIATGSGLLAAALFYGDSIVTPAISTLSASEGLKVVAPAWGEWSTLVAGALLAILFIGQRDSAETFAGVFGPVMVVWFLTLAVLGVRNIALAPQILQALSPHHALGFLIHGGWPAFLALGAVVLAITGCEALYTEMGLFGRLPIRLAWYLLVLPSLMLNYMGQGGLLLSKGQDAAVQPFFMMAPHWAGGSLVALAMLAALIAGHSVISSAFSMTRQAIQLGFLPRLAMIHISHSAKGRVYIPTVNWLLMLASLGLLVGFGNTANMAAAYGVAVTGTMLIGTVLLALVTFLVWGWRRRRTTLVLIVILVVDLTFFLVNLAKIPGGGWFTLGVALVIFIMLTTWKAGRVSLLGRFARDALPVEMFLASVSKRAERVPGTAIFLTATRTGVPMALMHNLKHNKVIHERVVICTVVIEEVPSVAADRRIEMLPISDGFCRLILRYGFMEEPNIPKALAQARSDDLGFFYEPMSISYFLSRETLLPGLGKAKRKDWAYWREQLFAWMAHSSAGSLDFFHLPPNRVVELGTQVELTGLFD